MLGGAVAAHHAAIDIGSHAGQGMHAVAQVCLAIVGTATVVAAAAALLVALAPPPMPPRRRPGTVRVPRAALRWARAGPSLVVLLGVDRR